ncbi:MAG: C25 family cysteine peptidase [Ignavibacteriaceae bacterium]|nr:C25 family cysteine peptidase [Ignavibacteriaceae bacterium]
MDYLFLVGQAVVDVKLNYFRNAGGIAKYNQVYTYGFPASDPMFGIFDTSGAYIQQFLIGRLPAKEPSQVRSYTQRLRDYKTQRFTEWNKSALVFSGGNFNDPNQIEQFKSLNQSIVDTIIGRNPYGMDGFHFYKTINPVTSLGPYLPETIKSRIDRGGLFMSYLGHSAVQTWDNGIISPEQLLNKENKSPLVTDFGCATGSHARWDLTSFSELFMTSEIGQAIGYIGNASVGFVSTSLTAPSIFYYNIFSDSVYNMSRAHLKTKTDMRNSFGNSGANKVFTLTSTYFGDPTVRIAIPSKPNLTISQADVSLLNTGLVYDTDDSVTLRLSYKNLGSVRNDSFVVRIKHLFRDTTEITDLRKMLPAYSDSLEIKIKVAGRPGSHRVELILNEGGLLDELYTDDNTASFDFEVYGTDYLSIAGQNQSGVFSLFLPVLNPRGSSVTGSVSYQISTDRNFTNAQLQSVNSNTFATLIPLGSLVNNQRYWFRIKNQGKDGFGNLTSFIKGNEVAYLINDSTAFAAGETESAAISGGIVLDSLIRRLKVISAGFNDGNTAVIELDGVNYVAESTLRGTNFCFFDRKTFQFKENITLSLSATQAQIDAMNAYLDALDSNTVVIVAISDSPQLPTSLRNRLKEFGSKLVTSVGFRHSWSFIGFRGADSTEVREVWKRPYNGMAEIDTLIQSNMTSGKYITEVLGPVRKWNNITVVKNQPVGTLISHSVVGIKSNGTTDTLITNQTGTSVDLNPVNAGEYPLIRIVNTLKDTVGSRQLKLNNISVSFDPSAEIGTNLRALALTKDTVALNDSLALKMKIFNAGLGKSDSFYVKVDLYSGATFAGTILNQKINNLNAGDSTELNVVHRALEGNGGKKFVVTIDPQNYVPELYEDNNTAEISFTEVLGFDKPYVRTQFNGQDIYDGDYVSNKPEITIDLYDPSTSGTVDTTLIRLLLNNRRIFLNSPDVSFTLRNTNPRVSLSYKPILAAGEYELKVTGTGASGTPIDSAGSVKNFVVSDENKILQVFNYPNPFVNVTYFTFKATNLPDEVQILIYTVAGRMIKKITKTAGDLRYDFNRIYWDGRDEDGDLIASGTYLYRVIMKKNGETQTVTEKLSVVR